MTSQTVAPAAEILRPYIAGRAERVSRRRTDRSDVARILADGAYSAAAHSLIEATISATIPPAVVDEARIERLSVAYTEAASAAGVSIGLDGYARHLLSGSQEAYRNGIYAEAMAAEAPRYARSAALDAAVRAWYAEHAAAIQQIAAEEAGRLLAARGQATTRTYADLFGEDA